MSTQKELYIPEKRDLKIIADLMGRSTTAQVLEYLNPETLRAEELRALEYFQTFLKQSITQISKLSGTIVPQSVYKENELFFEIIKLVINTETSDEVTVEDMKKMYDIHYCLEKGQRVLDIVEKVLGIKDPPEANDIPYMLVLSCLEK